MKLKKEMKQKIGITGGIGSGKSFIGNILLKMGYPLYDCDFRAKCMMREEGRLKNDIISVFGEKSYVDGDLNVAFLSELLFNDRRSLELMNSIVHPVVIDDFLLWCEMQIEDLIDRKSVV